MTLINPIQNVSGGTSFWTLLFIAISIFGIYISIILLVRNRFDGRRFTYLGIYTAALSFLLFHLSSKEVTFRTLEPMLNALGNMQLFLIGPFSSFFLKPRSHNRKPVHMLLHVLPATLAFICLVTGLMEESKLHLPGMIHMGLYFFDQLLKLIKKGHLDNVFIVTQLILFLGTGISCLWVPIRFHDIIACAGLAILILLIWVRLLYASFLSYILSRS